MLKAAQAYFQTQVTTTTQGNLLLMLYDGAIKFLKQAKEKIQEKNYAQKGILISKAMDIISELDSSLNSQKGGDLANNLHNLYFFCNTRLLKANLHMDVELIDEVVKILSGLRDAFGQIIKDGASDPPRVAPTPQRTAQTAQPTSTEQAPPASPGIRPAPLGANQAGAVPSAGPAPLPGSYRKTPPLPQTRPAQAARPETVAEAPAPTAAPAQNKPAPPAPISINQGRLLAGSNMYRKMASRTT